MIDNAPKFQYYESGDGQTLYNDYVILKLSRPLILNYKTVYPACLPDTRYMGLDWFEGNEECFTSGWGSTKSGRLFPNIKTYVSHYTDGIISLPQACFTTYTDEFTTYKFLLASTFMLQEFHNFIAREQNFFVCQDRNLKFSESS